MIDSDRRPATTIRRHPERSAPGERAAILAAGLVAHVGFVEDGAPVVIPMTYHFDATEPERLFLHGSHASRLVAHAASGAPLCVTVTIVEGLVRSKTAMNHSLNYRSAVVFGRGRALEDRALKARMFERLIGRYHEGRTPGREYAPPSDAQLDATAVVEVAIEAASAKTRAGGPIGPLDADPAAPGDAGVTPAPSALCPHARGR